MQTPSHKQTSKEETTTGEEGYAGGGYCLGVWVWNWVASRLRVVLRLCTGLPCRGLSHSQHGCAVPFGSFLCRAATARGCRVLGAGCPLAAGLWLCLLSQSRWSPTWKRGVIYEGRDVSWVYLDRNWFPWSLTSHLPSALAVTREVR